MPDVSPEFSSEMAALLAYYSSRIEAAKHGLSRNAARAVVLAILNEQTVAVRALTDRWSAASQKQQAEKPDRPTGNARRKDDDPNLT